MSRSKQKNNNASHIKKTLVEDLDDFLLDQEVSPVKRQAALQHLDTLINQDLSEASFLVDQYKAKLKSEVKQINKDNVSRSQNVLDLRQLPAKKEPAKEHFVAIKNWQQNRKQKIQTRQPRKKIAFNLPKIELPKFSFGVHHLGLRLSMFALIVAVLLLPIRGLVLFGQIQTDKDAIWKLGQDGLANLQSGVLSAAEDSYQAANINFEEALQNFSAIQEVLSEYEEWMIAAGTKLPLVGKPLSLSTNLLQVANNISQAAVTLNKKLEDNASLTDHIVFIDSQIDETLPYLSQASQDISNININKLPADLQVYFQDLQAYLPQVTTSLSNLDEVFDILLEVLGHEQEKRYLVLFQNNNELRATGGFVGSLALLDIYQGKINNLEIPKGGAYDLSAGQTVKIKAPRALSLLNPYFNIWDANWWPDFPTSAQKIIWFYENFGGSAIDGVIAINADVLQDLLTVVGPIELLDYDLTIDADNLFTVIQEEVEYNYDKEANTPKAIIADLAPIILDKLLSGQDKQKEIVTVLVDQLASKDIQIYSQDSKTQEKIHQFGWSGAMLDNQRDYLNVVSTNIAGGKTDNDIYQTIDHQTEILSNGEIINTVRVTRTNRGIADNPLDSFDGNNLSYLRFYVPLNSEFIEAIGFDELTAGYFHAVEPGTMSDKDVAAEEEKMIDAESQTEIYESLDKTVFANWLALHPGESKTIAVKYKLPFKIDVEDPLINNWWQKLWSGDMQLDHYSLLVQSQSGSKQTVFNSSILLPDNLKVVWNKAMDEQQMSVNNRLVTYTNDLIGDQYFGFIVTAK
jgi:hypothetical protein